jgi:hypothetical protein
MRDDFDLDEAWARAQLLASLEPGMDEHALLLRALRPASADPVAERVQASDALHARLADHVMQARAIRTRAAARLGLHPDDLGVLMASPRGGMRAALMARASYDAWPAQEQAAQA